jgi:UDP-N-acetylmuramoylalanine--D-glutamate ligase
MEYENKKIAVIGLGVSNTPLIRYLVNEKANVFVFDKKEAAGLEKYVSQLSGLKVNYCLGPDYLEQLRDFDIIFVTPGMKKDLPELLRAKAEGAVFSSEMELFLRKCPGRIIGITGSSGKTTTTTLTGLMVKADFPNTYIGGNIGCSLLDFLPEMTTDSRVILELSSFQLQDLTQSPDCALITNITPNHLDMHASMAEYIGAKANILRFQSPDRIAILNYDNDITRELASSVKGRLFFFSRKKLLDEGAFLNGTELIVRLNGQSEVIAIRDQLRLLGDHNIENILAAALISTLQGVSIETIAKVAREFSGVEHRLELVRELNGVKFYNDSISTTPDRAIAGLNAMTAPTILIAGGYDKHLPFDRFAKVVTERCKHLIVLGVTASQIKEEVQKIAPDFPIESVHRLEDAVAFASTRATSGDVVLLSPACASYDMFNNYQERGRLFKKLVNELEKH